jgi:membrane protein implicated in regulation of membrane protease activity
MLDYFFTGLGAWAWIIIGLLLMGLELAVPGAFMIWLGLAAIATGIIAGIFDIGWQAGMLIYAVLALAAVVMGRWLTRSKSIDRSKSKQQAEPELNRSDRALIGQSLRLDTAIVDGVGRVRVNDSSWRVVGPDMPAGERVRVIGMDGATLEVEAE